MNAIPEEVTISVELNQVSSTDFDSQPRVQ